MKRYPLFVLLGAPLAVACGETVMAVGPESEAGVEGGAEDTGSSADTGPADASAPSDGATFACGEASCVGNEVCVHPGCGCLVAVYPVTDSGSCPDGTAFADAVAGCVPIKMTCPPAYCWSPNGYSLECSGQDGSLSGIFDSFPDGSDLVCYSPCI
jgi:hypothetical protein